MGWGFQSVKACTVCRKDFEPRMPLARVCSLPCARKVPILKRKAEAADFKRRKEGAKGRKWWLKAAEEAVNEYIRLRDATLPCISCGTFESYPYWTAGHFLSVGAHPELRYEEDNIHKQCVRCNKHLAGNVIAYRINLLAKIGADGVARLEGPWPVRKYTVDELRVIRDDSRARVRHIKERNE
jgi:hypothetical protein